MSKTSFFNGLINSKENSEIFPPEITGEEMIIGNLKLFKIRGKRQTEISETK